MRNTTIHCLLLVCCHLALGLPGALAREVPVAHRPAEIRSPARAASQPSALVGRLIADLGHENYTVRRAAEHQLIEMSQAAFDHLLAAQEHEDLEIASQAHYLLHRLPIAWTTEQDSQEVRKLMERYARSSHSERRQVIQKLADLPNDEGIAALVRIARFESSSQLARHAALAILAAHAEGEENQETLRTAERAIQLSKELTDSNREAAHWLRLYFTFLESGEHHPEDWLAAIDEELRLLELDDQSTEREIAIGLLNFHLELSASLEEPEAVFHTLRRITDLRTSERVRPRQSVGMSLAWILEKQQWKALERFEEHYADTIDGDRLLLYMVAAARAKQGQTSAAEALAEEAFRLPEDTGDRNQIAEAIAELGHHDWSEREWRFLVDTLPIADNQSLYARRSLASWRLHDRGEHQAAADLLSEVIDAVESDADVKRQVFSDNTGRFLFGIIRSQREYFRACHFESEGKIEEQKKYLERAHQLDASDPDVLIAMYRLPDQSEEYRTRVSARIRKARNDVQQNIDQAPEVAHWYNHYAWLVSNTEGDYEKAVRYSLRSLEIQPGSPSFLDTLGRCYYAVGDLENAIKYQRQAVEKHPQVQVLRNQLKLFEDTLAAKQERSSVSRANEP